MKEPHPPIPQPKDLGILAGRSPKKLFVPLSWIFIFSMFKRLHLVTEEQLTHIAQKFWKNKDYIILKLALKKLVGRLIHEVNPGGTTLYYHLYDGHVPLDAVVEVTAINAVNR